LISGNDFIVAVFITERLRANLS